jgi:hypothetical protein
MAIPTTNIIFKNYANGIRDVKTGKFYPYKVDTFVPGVAILPQKQNVRYYIKSAVISYSSLVTDAGTQMTVTGNIDLQSRILASIIKTTLVVNNDSEEFDIGVLLDYQSVVAFTATTITSAILVLKWAEVDVNEQS